MSDEQGKSSLKANLKRFLVHILTEEASDPRIGVVRKELADELTKAVNEGFQGKQITGAMEAGIEATFRSPKIKESLSASFGPAIQNAATETIGKYVDRIEKAPDLKKVMEALQRLEKRVAEVPTAKSMRELQDEVSHARGDILRLSNLLDKIRLDPSGPRGPAATSESNSGALAGSDFSFDKAEPHSDGSNLDPSGKPEHSVSPAAGQSKPFRSLAARQNVLLLIAAAVAVAFFFVGFISAGIFAGEGDRNGPAQASARDEPVIESLEPSALPRQLGNDTLRGGQGDIGDMRRDEQEPVLSEMDQVEKGLVRLARLHANAGERVDFCESPDSCRFEQFWPEDGQVTAENRVIKFKLAQAGINYLKAGAGCASTEAAVQTIIEDGDFGPTSVNAAMAVYDCRKKAGLWGSDPTCSAQTGDDADALGCALFWAPETYRADRQEMLAMWIALSVGGGGE